MAAAQFTSEEWRKINQTLEQGRTKYGLPQREYGSVLLGSFNIRKLGSTRSRSPDTWKFLAEVCRSFDLLSVQEIMDDLSGLRRLMSLLGPDFDLIVSDVTGKFPGEPGLGERMGFIYRWSAVKRTEVATDITYDRTKVLNTIAERYDEFDEVMDPYADRWLAYYVDKTTSSKPRLKLPFFLTFIRQPFCVSFEIPGLPGTKPYRFMTINAHLNFGKTLLDRKVEFDALMDWIRGRAAMDHRAYYRDFLLMGDLNLNFDNPEADRPDLEAQLKTFNGHSGDAVNVNFPFLDTHPTRTEPFRTNARLTETFDQIGLFSHDDRLPTFEQNATMGTSPRGPDYGVFEFVRLFSDALLGKPFDSLAGSEKSDFFVRFEHKVSDHMPLWVRLKLPDI